MKKLLVIVISVVLVFAIPITASAGNKNGTTKELNIKEVTAGVLELPETLMQGEEFGVVITVPRSGSAWEYGEIAGLIDPVTVFDEETCEYITTALVDTSAAGTVDIIFEFLMVAGKSHNVFKALYTGTVEIIGAAPASAANYFWNQDFSTDASGWAVGVTTGTVTVADGTALMTPGFTGGGSYSFFEGSNKDWTGDWYASVKVYIDPASLETGEGFDYIVAINEADGTYLAEYGFTAVSDGSAVAISCIGLGGSAEITQTGWYELRHFFYDNGGTLSVEMNVFAPGGAAILTETVDTSFLIPDEVGGSRYGWFTSITAAEGILIDDFMRYAE